MSLQRSDHRVLSDAALKAEKTAELRRYLRQCGVRDPHTSRKAREAQLRASVMTFEDKAELTPDEAFSRVVAKGMFNGLVLKEPTP